MTAILKLGECNKKGEWNISPFWIELMGDLNEILLPLREFIDLNQGTAPEGIVWDTMKA